MSSFDIIPLVVIILSLAGIIIIAVRKFPALASIDVSAIPREKEAEVKEKIITERFERKTLSALRKIILPFKLWFKDQIKKIHVKILELEKYYQRKPKVLEDVKDLELKIKKLLVLAEEFVKEGKLKEAEEKYIEIISLDHRNIAAYKGLGDIYLAEKNYEFARETFEYILKIKPDDVDTYINLGLLWKALNDNEKALNYFNQAVTIEPKNPRSLDFLLEMSIILGNKLLANETFKKLKEVNSENQKLKEFEERIKSM